MHADPERQSRNHFEIVQFHTASVLVAVKAAHQALIKYAASEDEPYKAQEDLNLFLEVFPSLKERLRITQLCKGIGLAVETIKRLFKGEAITITGKLY